MSRAEWAAYLRGWLDRCHPEPSAYRMGFTDAVNMLEFITDDEMVTWREADAAAARGEPPTPPDGRVTIFPALDESGQVSWFCKSFTGAVTRLPATTITP